MAQKYKNDSYFYCSKPINELILSCSTLNAIKSKDIFLYAGGRQYLRRIYRTFNALDQKQIENRIELLSQFYEQIPTLGSFYPNMFISRTDKIIKNRFRKLRKLKASCGSSDQSSEESVDYRDQSFQTFGFLKSMATPSSSGLSGISQIQISEIFPSAHHSSTPQSINEKQLNEMDEEVHDIYEEQSPGLKLESIDEMNTNRMDGKEEGLEHLISDFKDLDVEKVKQEYRQLMWHLKHNAAELKKQNSKEIESILFKPEESHISQHHKKLKEQRKVNGSDPHRIYREQKIEEINKYRHFPNSLAAKQGYDSLERLKREKENGKKGEHRVRGEKPKSVRDKARQLLEKVKKRSYI